MTKPKAIVVGAGIGGTAVAARLSLAGYQVTVYEKNDVTGGRCSLVYSKDGTHRFDRGPSLLLLPRIFEETFNDLGTSLEKEDIHLKGDWTTQDVVHFGDGQCISLSTDLASMKKEIERFEGEDGFEGFLRFLCESHRHYELSLDHVLHQRFDSIWSLLRPSFLFHIFSLHPFTSLYSRASKYFESERLRRAFTFASMYMGMSPMDAPGTYSLLQYTELTEGIWYPKGGFHKVVAGLEQIARRQGVTFRTSTPVKRVRVNKQQKATGVELEDGTIDTADVVCINADLVYAYNDLLPTPSSYTDSLNARQSSCSSISFYWALDRTVPKLGAHNIFLANEYKTSFDAIFKRHNMPKEPSFYVNVPSRIDPSAAPEGKDAVVVLVPVGHIKKTKKVLDYSALVARARSLVFETLSQQLGLKDFPSYIIEEQHYDPLSWESGFNLDKGAILGLSHSFFNVLSFRPKSKHDTISNCYFVGASTHPGTGVPIVLAGAKLVTEQILNDGGTKVPWEAWERPYLESDIKMDQPKPKEDSQSFRIAKIVLLLAILMGLRYYSNLEPNKSSSVAL